MGETMKMIAALLFACGSAIAAGQVASVTHNPLQRQYHEADALVYRMNGVNESWHYTVVANGTVKKDGAGAYFEEYKWSGMETGGQPVALRADMDAFRQRLSLDPNQNPSIPDLSKVDPKLIGPVTDLMTFYADLWLANKIGALTKAGDHFYFRNPMPASSWADGVHTLIGESAIDFDMTLKAVDAAAGTAVLVVKHVPPEKSPVKLPADWMQKPVGDAPNNWVGVTKEQNGSYTAAVGEENFTVEIKLSLADGRILSATMDNPVKTIERTCEDAALTKCGDVRPHEILRKIDIALVP
ncbi:MAG: hypothetical protein ABSG51_01610 [Terracidiphilus sp.]|jgi:hypothetical protein